MTHQEGIVQVLGAALGLAWAGWRTTLALNALVCAAMLLAFTGSGMREVWQHSPWVWFWRHRWAPFWCRLEHRKTHFCPAQTPPCLSNPVCLCRAGK